MIRDYASVDGLLATEALEQICYYLPDGWKIKFEVIWGSVFCKTLLQNIS
jgi:hypothetical protein